MKRIHIMILVVLAMVFTTSSAFPIGMVYDDNDGSAGQVLVNTGETSSNGNDIGTWQDPNANPSLKGAKGDSAERNQLEAGPGVDVLLWQSPKGIFGVETQYRYDTQSNSHAVYGVLKVNAWGWFQSKTKAE